MLQLSKKKIVVVLSSSFKGWILEGQIRDAAHALEVKIKLRFKPHRKLHLFRIFDLLSYVATFGQTGPFLIINQTTFFSLVSSRIRKINPSICDVFYTHFTECGLSREQQAHILSSCRRILVYNSTDKNRLIIDGVPKEKLAVVYGGIDRNLFYPQQKSNYQDLNLNNNYVLIAGDCKLRKNPFLILEVIKKMVNQNFIIHGRGWEEFLLKNSIKKPVNLQIKEFQFSHQPKLIREASVYLSLSTIEGGPFPTLEALASGTPVVATPTGWNSEIILENCGYILQNNPILDEVISAILLASNLKSLVRHKDLLNGNFTWEQFGKELFYLKEFCD